MWSLWRPPDEEVEEHYPRRHCFWQIEQSSPFPKRDDWTEEICLCVYYLVVNLSRASGCRAEGHCKAGASKKVRTRATDSPSSTCPIRPTSIELRRWRPSEWKEAKSLKIDPAPQLNWLVKAIVLTAMQPRR